MNIEDYLPSEHWMSNAKDLIKNHKLVAGFGAIGLASFVMPVSLILFPSGPSVTWVAIKLILDLQRDLKIKAIMDAFPGKYSHLQLSEMHKRNRSEFNRLFKLASDEFFRKYVQEQEEHLKAQQLIVNMQKRIDKMRQHLEVVQRKESRHRTEIEMLKVELQIYEDVLGSWQRKAA
jgi:hypothetical protein